MTKREMAVNIAEELQLQQKDVMQVVERTFDYISDELAEGRRVEFRNFGIFEPAVRKPRIGRNPNSPEQTVTIPSRVVVKFKAGKKLQERIEQLDPNDVEE